MNLHEHSPRRASPNSFDLDGLNSMPHSGQSPSVDEQRRAIGGGVSRLLDLPPSDWSLKSKASFRRLRENGSIQGRDKGRTKLAERRLHFISELMNLRFRLLVQRKRSLPHSESKLQLSVRTGIWRGLREDARNCEGAAGAGCEGSTDRLQCMSSSSSKKIFLEGISPAAHTIDERALL